MLRLALALVAALLLGGPAFSADVAEDPLERQVMDIAKDLRCAVCQNQPVSESNAELARDMRVIIREQLEAGRSREEIVDYFVQRYGDYVLMKPPFDYLGALLWVAPPLLLFLLGGFALMYIRSRTHQLASAPPTLSAEDEARVRAAREDRNA
jgi:cytochrome c-type biogenesis protein CcmH